MLETLYGTPLSDKHDNLVLSSDPARAICRAPGHSHVMFVTGTKMWLNGITLVVLFFLFSRAVQEYGISYFDATSVVGCLNIDGGVGWGMWLERCFFCSGQACLK